MSTVAMSVIVTNLFLVVTTICLTNRKLLIRAGYRIIALLLSFSALRLLLPVELPFTKTLILPEKISPFLSVIRTPGLWGDKLSLSWWNLFELVWLAGFIVFALVYLIQYQRTKKQITLYGKDLTKTQPYQDLIAQICKTQKRNNKFQIIALPYIDSPVIFGIFSPCILLPENFNLSENELYYILSHEASHHFHHDLLLKYFSQLLIYGYWWNPFGILLSRQIDVILEMRIDDALTNADVSRTVDYMKCLIMVAEQASDIRPFCSSAYLGFYKVKHRSRSDLMKRFELMKNNQQTSSRRLNLALFLIAGFLYIVSYRLIWEPSTTPEDALFLEEIPADDYIIPDNSGSYFIDNQNGTYDFYMMGTYIETIDSLEYYEDSIPVYSDPSMIP